MSATVFSAILAGEIPCHKVYEDERVLAFLDVAPLSAGHTLLIPKEPAASLADLSEDAAAALGRALPRLCRAIQRATGCPGYNVLQNNGATAHQAVFHVHFHIIPKFADGRGLGLHWAPGRLGNDQGTELATRLRQELSAETY